MQSKYPNPFTHPPKLFTPEELQRMKISEQNSKNGRVAAKKLMDKGLPPVPLRNTRARKDGGA